MFRKFKKNSNSKLSIQDLENAKKSKLNINKNKQKTVSPITRTFFKGVQATIYVSLIIIFVLGIYQIIKSKQPKIIKNIVEYNIAESESETAKAFALAFVKEYLTYSNTEQEDYLRRIRPFLINALSNTARIDYSKGSSRVLDAIVWDVQKLNNNHSNIIIRANIQTINQVDIIIEKGIEGEEITKPKIEEKVVYISVPIGYYEDGYLVEDYPVFMPEPQRPTEANFETYTGPKTALDDVEQQIEEVLTNFFITYSSGNEGQIAYYMEDNKKIKGYEGKYLFNSIETLDTYENGNGTYTTVTVIGMKDEELGTLYRQRYLIELIRKTEGNSDRFYIKDIKMRGNKFVEEDE